MLHVRSFGQKSFTHSSYHTKGAALYDLALCTFKQVGNAIIRAEVCMSEQDGQVATVQRPITDNRGDWKTYWEAQGQPWRTEPEIGEKRQKYLAECRAIVPDIGQG